MKQSDKHIHFVGRRPGMVYDHNSQVVRKRRNLIDPFQQMIIKREAARNIERLKDRYERAITLLQRKFKPVCHAAPIDGGAHGRFIVGYIPGRAAYRIIGRRALLALADKTALELDLTY